MLHICRDQIDFIGEKLTDTAYWQVVLALIVAFATSSTTYYFTDRSRRKAELAQAKSSGSLQYSCMLPADYIDPKNKHHFLNELQPHLYFKKNRMEMKRSITCWKALS